MTIFYRIIYISLSGLILWALGKLVLKSFFRRTNLTYSFHNRVLSFITGNIAFSYLLTLLGFLGLFNSFIFYSVFFALIILIIFVIIKKFFFLKKTSWHPSCSKSSLNFCPDEKIYLIFGIILVSFFLLFPLLQSNAPPYMRDSLVYHLLCPKEYLKAGQLIYIDGNLYSAFPKGHEVLVTFLLGTIGERAAQGISVLQNIAAFISLFLIIRLITNSFTALTCTLGYATLPPAIYFSGCGYVEPALLMAFAGSLLALFVFLNKKSKDNNQANLNLRESAFIGFLAGWMPTIKYTGFLYLGLIGLLILWNQKKAPIIITLKNLGTFALMAAPGFCWLVWNWIKLGNPVYPFAYGLFGGIGWDEVRDRAMYLYFQMFGMGKEFWDYILLPWRFSFLGRFDTIYFDGAMGPFLLIFIFLALFSAVKRLSQSYEYEILNGMGIILLISAALFVFGSQQARFWLPSQILLCIYAAPAVDRINTWANKRPIAKFSFTLIILFGLIWNAWFLGKQVISVGYYKPALGLEKEETFLKRVVPGYAAIEFINKNLKQDSHIFCIWTGAYGYYINVPYYSDTLIEDVTFKKYIDESRDWKVLYKKLAEKGFTHIFLRISLTKNNMTPTQLAIFKNFMQNGAMEIYRNRDFAVFKILTPDLLH